MPAEDYREGVEGAGSAWQEEVDTDEAEQSYESGASQDAAAEFEDNASAASNDYEEGLADYFGIDAEDVTTGNEFSSGVSDAGSDWRQGVGNSGDKWRRGVQRTDADEWEEAAAASADEWFDRAREGVQD